MYKYIFLLFTILLLFPFFASAVNLNLNYPVIPGAPDINDPAQQNLNEIIIWFYYFFVGIAGLLAFIMLVVAGFQWLTSAGNASRIGDAKDRATKALLGLLLVFGSFVIIQFLNPGLTLIGSQLNNVFGPDPIDLLGEISDTYQYRCTRLGGIDNNYECVGQPPEHSDHPLFNEPLVAKPFPPGFAVKIQRDDGAFSNCLTQCRNAARGESAKFIIGGEGVWYCVNPVVPGKTCSIGGETVEFHWTTTPLPVNQSVMRASDGVYGCDDDGCKKAWRKFVQGLDTPDICEILPLDASPEGDKICKQIGSLYIHGPFVAVLFKDEEYKGESICFDGRDSPPEGVLINRLDDFAGWGNEADSLKVLADGSSEIGSLCPVFEQTI